MDYIRTNWKEYVVNDMGDVKIPSWVKFLVCEEISTLVLGSRKPMSGSTKNSKTSKTPVLPSVKHDRNIKHASINISTPNINEEQIWTREYLQQFSQWKYQLLWVKTLRSQQIIARFDFRFWAAHARFGERKVGSSCARLWGEAGGWEG